MEKLKIVVDDKGNTKVWMDGKLVVGATRVKFEYNIDDLPRHEIDFVTQAGGLKDER